MAKRKHLPVIKAGKKYEGWMAFGGFDVPLFGSPWAGAFACSEVFASRAEALRSVMTSDVRRVTIIVEDEPKPKKKSR